MGIYEQRSTKPLRTLEFSRVLWQNRIYRRKGGKKMHSREKRQTRDQVEIVCIEDVVPKNHILRDIDRTINFEFIYDEVKDLYSDTNRQLI